MSQLTPRFAGRYVLSKKLGEGAMGVVFAAYDERLERTVALKVLRSPSDERARARLLREARNLAQLSDPHVVQVHDTGEFEGEVFLAMEHVEGQTLAEWRRSRRALAEVTDALLAAGRGLAAAHAKGIVHRDIKPGNILIGADARARVADFGLAIVGAIEGPTEDGAPAGGALAGPGLTRPSSGTPAYMAPEQHAGGELTPRADLFSYCVVFWEAVFGALPFPGDANACREAILAGTITPPETRPKEVPPRLEQVLRRGLAARLELRPASMEELLAALEEVLHPRRVGRWIAGGALCVGLGAALSTFFTPSEARACQHAGEKIAAVWTSEAKAALRSALAADPLRGTLVYQQVEAAAEELQTLSGSLCAAHRDGALSDPQYHRGQRCLDARREDLAALLTVLASPSEHLSFVPPDDVAQALGLAARCGDANYLAQDVPPPPPDVDASLDEVDATRRTGEAALLRGDFAAAAARFADASEQARVIGYAPATADALVDLGRAQLRLRRSVAAGESLREARLLAEASNDVYLAADASLLMINAAVAAHKIGEARWLERETEAKLRQSGQTKGALAGLLALARADLRVQELDPDAAEAALNEAEGLLRGAPPGLWQYNLPRIRGQVEALRERHDAALKHSAAARDALTRLTGSPEHPLFPEDLGLHMARVGDPAAKETLEQMRLSVARAFGEDAPQLASVDAALIRASERTGGDAILTIGARARRILDLHRDEPATFTARVDVALNVGREHVRRQETAAALAVFRWGLEGLEAVDAPALGPSIAPLAAAAADSAHRLGDLAGARADIEAALRHLPHVSRDSDRIYVLRIAAEVAAAARDPEAVIRHGEAALALSPDPLPRASIVAVLAPALGCSERTLGLAREARQQFLADDEPEDAGLLSRWIAMCEKGSSREGASG